MNAVDMRALGLDLGQRRIGVAVSDSGGRVATPIDTIDGRDRPAAWRRVRELAAEWEAGVVVIGLPLSLDGTDGPAATQARADAAVIAKHVDLPVELHDERLTTVTAHRELQATNMSGKERRKVVDMVAASVMLQSWLDGADSEEDS